MSDVPAARDPKRLTRRQLLIAAAAGTATVAAGGTAAYLATRGSGDDPAPVADTPAPPTAAPVTPKPSPTAVPEGPIVTRVPDPFERKEFAQGELIDWPRGVFFMEVNTGAITGYRRPSDPEPYLTAAGGGRIVLAGRAGEYPPFLLDRTTGSCWYWDGEARGLVTATPTKFVLRRLGRDLSPQDLAAYNVVDVSTGEVDTLVFPPDEVLQWLTEGDVAAVLPNGEFGRLELIDLVSGDRRPIQVAEPDLEGKHLFHTLLSRGARGIQVTAIYETVSGPVIGEGWYSVVHISWDGQVLRSSPLSLLGEALQLETWSPDGRFILRQQSLFDRPRYGHGDQEHWPAAVLFDAEDNPLLRIRSAALPYGDQLPNNRWLADSSAFVAAIHTPASTETGQNGYALFSTSGQMTVLPRVADQLPFVELLRNVGPVPSPANADLLNFGRFYLYNRSAQQWFIPNLRNNGGAAHLWPEDSPWVAGPNEMVFALEHGGHGGGYSPALPAPFLERAPFPASPAMRFRVSGTGSCLNVRAQPAVDAESLACLLDGTVVELDVAGEVFNNGFPTLSHIERDRVPWSLVRGPGGVRGWVSTDFLAWDACNLWRN